MCFGRRKENNENKIKINNDLERKTFFFNCTWIKKENIRSKLTFSMIKL